MRGAAGVVGAIILMVAVFGGWELFNRNKDALPDPVRGVVDSLQQSAGIPTEPLIQEVPEGVRLQTECPAYANDLAEAAAAGAAYSNEESTRRINASWEAATTAIGEVVRTGRPTNLRAGPTSDALHELALTYRSLAASMEGLQPSTPKATTEFRSGVAVLRNFAMATDELLATGSGTRSAWAGWATVADGTRTELGRLAEAQKSCP